jgi:predicted O-linked N-acetylglucosamine transferase (SPINDLY family)
LCYQPPPARDVRPPPCLGNGYLTFGSFNTLSKLNSRVIAVWSRLLQQAPGSRLLLKGRMLRFKGVEEHLHRQFQEHGIEPDRVECVKWIKSPVDHLDLYKRVDIALDPFPYNGTTTSCEALWMGVPVVTLAGQEHVSRVGVSLLTQVGLEDWIADSAAAYIDCAAAWGEKPNELATLRGRLRERMAVSGLCDALAHTRALETAYRNIWQRWLNQTGSK